MSFPYYRWFPGDYLRDTRRLSMLQHGAYRLLIDEYMVTGRPLPNDLPALYRICGAVSGEEHAAVRYVLEEFFRLDGPVWRHKRCDEELSRQSERSASAQESASKRWSKSGRRAPVGDDANAYANALPSDREGICDRNANQNQIQREKERSAPNGALSRARVTPAALAMALRKAGIEAQSGDPRLQALAQQDVAVETVTAAADEAKRKKPGERVPVGFVLAILERWAQQAVGLQAGGARLPPSRASPPTKAESFIAKLNGSQPDTIDAIATVAAPGSRRLGA